MTRAARAVAATAAALLALVLVPAASDAGPNSSKIIETIWHVTPASGAQVGKLASKATIHLKFGVAV
jgi:hypothetical protein